MPRAISNGAWVMTAGPPWIERAVTQWLAWPSSVEPEKRIRDVDCGSDHLDGLYLFCHAASMSANELLWIGLEVAQVAGIQMVNILCRGQFSTLFYPLEQCLPTF